MFVEFWLKNFFLINHRNAVTLRSSSLDQNVPVMNDLCFVVLFAYAFVRK